MRVTITDMLTDNATLVDTSVASEYEALELYKRFISARLRDERDKRIVSLADCVSALNSIAQAYCNTLHAFYFASVIR